MQHPQVHDILLTSIQNSIFSPQCLQQYKKSQEQKQAEEFPLYRSSKVENIERFLEIKVSEIKFIKMKKL